MEPIEDLDSILGLIAAGRHVLAKPPNSNARISSRADRLVMSSQQAELRLFLADAADSNASRHVSSSSLDRDFTLFGRLSLT